MIEQLQESLAEWVCERLDAGSDPGDIAEAIATFDFVVNDEQETLH